MLRLKFVQSNCYTCGMNLHVELEQETDGRWIAEVPELPGMLVYGETRKAAINKVERLAIEVNRSYLNSKKSS